MSGHVRVKSGGVKLCKGMVRFSCVMLGSGKVWWSLVRVWYSQIQLCLAVVKFSEVWSGLVKVKWNIV